MIRDLVNFAVLVLVVTGLAVLLVLFGAELGIRRL